MALSESIIDSVYSQLLRRIANQGELDDKSTSPDFNTASDLVNDIKGSDEYATLNADPNKNNYGISQQQVIDMYVGALNRQPTPAEIRYWRSRSFFTADKFRTNIFNSPEWKLYRDKLIFAPLYQSLYKQVSAVYQQVLKRVPTQGEFERWLVTNVPLTSDVISRDLYNSDEWQYRKDAILNPIIPATRDEIIKAYVDVLKRYPTAAELNNRLSLNQSAAWHVSSLKGSDEYELKLDGIITRAFNDILRRDPTQQEIVDILSRGAVNEVALRIELYRSDEGRAVAEQREQAYIYNMSDAVSNAQVVDSVRKFVQKVKGESFSSDALKASIALESFELYGINHTDAKKILGFSTEDQLVNFLNQAIDPNETIYANETAIVPEDKARDANGNLIGRTKEFNRLDFEKLKREIWSQKNLLGIRYSHASGFNDAQLVNFLAYGLINLLGVTQLSDFGMENTFINSPVDIRWANVKRGDLISYPRYFNKRTGQESIRSDYSRLGGNVDWLDPGISARAFWVFQDGTRKPAQDSGSLSWYSFKEKYPSTASHVEFVQHHWYASKTGEGIQRFFVTFTDSGYPILQVSNEATGFFADFGDLLPIISLALAFTGAGSFIGSQLLGTLGVEVATIETAVVNAVGNAAINTVLSGGDVVTAVTKSAGGLAGAYVGDFVGAGVDNITVGQAAGAGATAVINGTDITTAIVGSLANSAAVVLTAEATISQEFPISDVIETAASVNTTQIDTAALTQTEKIIMDDTINFDTTVFDVADTTNYDQTNYVYDASTSIDENLVSFTDLNVEIDPFALDQNIELTAADIEASGLNLTGEFPDDAGNLFDEYGRFTELSYDNWISSLYVDENGDVLDASGAVVVDSNTMDEIAALPADQVQAAFEDRVNEFADANGGQTTDSQEPSDPTYRPDSTPAPAPRTTFPMKPTDWAGIAKIIGAFGGAATSIIAAYKGVKAGSYRPGYGGTPPYYPQKVNQPVRTSDGRVITNNGNGTITTTYPNGQTVTTRASYTGSQSGTIAGIPTNLILIGGVALLGALVLSRR